MSPHHPPRPLTRLRSLFREDRGDLAVLLAYTILYGLLTLAIPLAAQALVNTVAAGLFIQPLVVLTAMVFFGLLFAGIVKILQFRLVEVLQQRVFARVALRLAERLPKVDPLALAHEYPPELVNRFFDVVNVQKTLSKILMDGPAACLQILVGLTLMAFYSPLLLAFDIVVLAMMALLIFPLGLGGLRTSLAESVRKYQVASWLEEIARCQIGFKLSAPESFPLMRADAIVEGYLDARQSHFRILLRQTIGHYLFQAIAGAGILGLGGWLVISRQLTLGQLVASELIVLIVVAALEKLVALFQEYFDLLTALEKISHITELQTERDSGIALPEAANGIDVKFRSVVFAYGQGLAPLSDLDLAVSSGERLSLVGASGSGKSTLALSMAGLLMPQSGSVQMDGIDTRDIDLRSLRRQIALVGGDAEIFEGSVEDNIRMGRDEIAFGDIRWALWLTGLETELASLSDGLGTKLVSGGRNLSQGQIQRLLLARAVVGKPRLLILDEAFSGLDEVASQTIIERLFDAANPWTVVEISHEPDIILRACRICVLEDGRIAATGSAQELMRMPNGPLAKLFPVLSLGGTY